MIRNRRCKQDSLKIVRVRFILNLPELVPFYNELATVTRVQHRTLGDCKNQSEYIVVKKLQQQQIHLKLLPCCLLLLGIHCRKALSMADQKGNSIHKFVIR